MLRTCVVSFFESIIAFGENSAYPHYRAGKSRLKKGQVVYVAGAVIFRQRPMTAKNVVFITLEDEFGHSNFVVMPDVFETYRSVINQNDYLIIRGIFEERGMLKALHFESIHSFTAEVVSHNFR